MNFMNYIEDDDKVYKITTYPNSDNEPNGITIKCNTEEFEKGCDKRENVQCRQYKFGSS